MPNDIMCNNSFKCWECTKSCEIKKSFSLPDEVFYAMINESSKASAGAMIACGMSYEKAEKERTTMVLTLVTSRMKCKEMNK